MASLGVGRAALVDASVNAVPLAMLVLSMAVFLAVDPWPPDLRSVVVSQGLLVVPIVVLFVVTLVAARAIGADGQG